MLELKYDRNSNVIMINAFRFNNYTDFGKDFEYSEDADDDLGENLKKYKLGQLLVDLIYIDHEEVNQIINDFKNRLLPINIKEYNEYLDYIWSKFHKMIEIHPYLEPLFQVICDSIRRYEKYLKDSAYSKFLNKNTEDPSILTSVDNFSDSFHALLDEECFMHANKLIVKDFKASLHHSFGSFEKYEDILETKTLKEYIDFCFFDNNYPEFDNLTPFQKFNIIDAVKSGMFGDNEFTSKFSLPKPKNLYDENLDLESPQSRKVFAEFVKTIDNNSLNEYSLEPKKALILEFLLIIDNSITIKKCNNCNKYFIPENREDEKYCNRFNSDGKTCKEVGWDNKRKPLEYIAYRKKYNVFLQYSKRNRLKFEIYNLKTELDTIFETWNQIANMKRNAFEKLEENSSEYINAIDEYLDWLDNSYLKIKRLVKGDYTAQEEEALNSNRKIDLIELIEKVDRKEK